MIKTVIFNAPPNSGKDFLGEKLAEFLEGPVLRFKDTLYEDTAKYLSLNKEVFIKLATDKRTKDAPMGFGSSISPTITPRQALIHVSENIIKVDKGKAYFGETLAKRLRQGWNIITDGGFEEEFVPVAEASDRLYVIQLSAAKCDFQGDSRDYLSYEFLDKFYNVRLIEYYNYKNGKLTATADLITDLHSLEGDRIDD